MKNLKDVVFDPITEGEIKEMAQKSFDDFIETIDYLPEDVWEDDKFKHLSELLVNFYLNGFLHGCCETVRNEAKVKEIIKMMDDEIALQGVEGSIS